MPEGGLSGPGDPLEAGGCEVRRFSACVPIWGISAAERQKLIPVGDARRLIQDILNTPPVLYAIDSLFYRAVEISSQTRTGFYDCLYVALAEQENCELVTADDKLINALQRQFAFILSLASLP